MPCIWLGNGKEEDEHPEKAVSTIVYGNIGPYIKFKGPSVRTISTRNGGIELVDWT